MKKLLFTISLCGIIIFAGQSLFAQTVGQCQTNYSLIQCGYYQEGYQDGVADAQNNRTNDYKTYRSKLDSKQNETFYQQGYDAGFSSIRPVRRWERDKRSAYDVGFQRGDSDKRRNMSRSPERYQNSYNRDSQSYFTQGYYDGFDGRPRQYDYQIGNNPSLPNNPYNPSFPNNPNYPNYPNSTRAGTATGSVSWSGKVDDHTNIIIQGDQVTEQIVSGNNIFPATKSINGVLPRVSSNISVNKMDGRGNATVVQQPSRENNYTAIVQVIDNKSGSDDYRLQISWQATVPVEEPYQSGRVSWRGRVDQTANIVIAGNTVQVQDASNTGVSSVTSNISGYLARRPGTVTVNKQKGRGSVTVLQQPSAENDFVAIVQISDSNRGASDYELDITW